MDAALVSTSAGFDLALDGDDLLADRGLVTAVAVSLFSDARAEAPASPLDLDQRGWWPDREGDRWGSKLWLLFRENSIRRNLTRAQTYAREALAWMVEDGIAAAVRVVATVGSGLEGNSRSTLYLTVTIVRGSRWQRQWEATADRLLLMPWGRLVIAFA